MAIPRTFRSILFLFGLGIGPWAISQPELIEKEDLRFRFITVSDEGEINIALEFQKYQTIGLFMNGDEAFDLLRICNAHHFHVWLNNRLHFVDRQCLDISRTELFDQAGSDSVYVVLNTAGDFADVSAATYDRGGILTTTLNPILPRPDSYMDSYMIFLLLFFLVGFGVVRNFFPRLYDDLFRISIFRKIRREERSAEFDLSIVVLAALLSVLGGFCYWYLRDFSSPNHLRDVWNDLLLWLKYSGVIFAALLVKYWFVGIISRLNAFRNFAYTQVYDFLRFFVFISVLLSSVFFCKYWLTVLDDGAPGAVWNYYYLAGYLGFIIYYYHKIALNVRYKKLHIISYLCSTEILGAVIVALIFTK